jgi:hypothetical protein
MNQRVLIAQLIAARAQIDATLEVLGATEEGCPHPDEMVLDLSTLGSDPTYQCRACGVTQHTPFHSQEG